jgi:uncharacterized membrane protein
MIRAMRLEVLFLYIAIIAGILIATLTPPMQVPDEDTHFWLAYNQAMGNRLTEQNGAIGHIAKQEVFHFIQDYQAKNNGLESSYSFGEMYINSFLGGSKSYQSQFIAYNKWAGSNVLAYLFSSTGMRIGMFLSTLTGYHDYLTPYNLLLFGRLGNLAFYIVAIYFALKRTRLLKKTMLIISLMPMSIFLGASTNYDAVCIPAALLFFSQLSNYLSDEDQPIGTKELILTSATLLFVSAVKPVSLPFSVLLFTIPVRRFSTRKRYAVSIAVCGAAMITGLILARWAAILHPAGENPLVAQQKEYLSAHWGQFPHIVFNTVKSSFHFWLEGFWGKLGTLNLNFPLPWMLLFYPSLFIVFFCEASSGYRASKLLRLLSFAGLVFSLVYMIYLMYVGWTPLVDKVGGDASTGIQGRYFIPLFCFAGFVFLNTKMLASKHREKIENITGHITGIVVSVCPVMTVLLIIMKWYMR